MFLRHLGTAGRRFWGEFLRPALAFVYMYSGMAFVVSKFIKQPAGAPVPPSGPVWLIGIYLTALGIAEQKYQRETDIERKNFETNYSQSLPGLVPCEMWDFYTRVWRLTPVEPRLFKPLTVYQALILPSVPTQDPLITNSNSAIGYIFIFGDSVKKLPPAKAGEFRMGFSGNDDSLKRFATQTRLLDGKQLWKVCESRLKSQPVYWSAYWEKFLCTDEVLGRMCAIEKAGTSRK